MNKIQVAFFGSSKFSLPFLELLNKMGGLELTLVISQPDKPTGRGLELTQTPVKLWAKEKNILVLTPTDLKDQLFLGTLKTLPLDLALCAYYGLIIPGQVVDHFPKGILNVHHSLLPQHRGSNPIPWTIISNEKMTGTTLIKIDEKIDGGLILGQTEEEIRDPDTTETLRQRLDDKALNLLKTLLPQYLTGELNLKNQTVDGSYDPKITKEMAKIDWQKSDEEIERVIRAFNPWPGAWTTLEELCSSKNIKYQISNIKNGNNRVKILKAHLDKKQNLMIDEIQIEGKKPMAWKEFENGYLN